MDLMIYTIEFLFLVPVTLLFNLFFFGIISVFFYKKIRKNKKAFTNIILVSIVIIIIVNSVGLLLWNSLIQNKLIREADPFVSSIPYGAISWEPSSIFDIEGLSAEEQKNNLYYSPLPPLSSLAQVSAVSYTSSFLQIITAYLLCLLYVFKKFREKTYYLYVSLIFLLQVCFLGSGLLLGIIN